MKTPRLIIDQDEACNISTDDGKSFAECFTEEYAELVVNAVNERADLIESLELALKYIDRTGIVFIGYTRAQDVLARAKG